MFLYTFNIIIDLIFKLKFKITFDYSAYDFYTVDSTIYFTGQVKLINQKQYWWISKQNIDTRISVNKLNPKIF